MSPQDNSKSYGWIFLKFWGYVEHGINYQWFDFGRDPAGILDSGSLWNFRYHCVKGGIREPLAKRRWQRHMANNIALAEVPAGYDCFLVRHNISHFCHILSHAKITLSYPSLSCFLWKCQTTQCLWSYITMVALWHYTNVYYYYHYQKNFNWKCFGKFQVLVNCSLL